MSAVPGSLTNLFNWIDTLSKAGKQADHTVVLLHFVGPNEKMPLVPVFTQ